MDDEVRDEAVRDEPDVGRKPGRQAKTYDYLKDTFESLRASSRRMHNLQELYKWSVLGGFVGFLGGLGAVVFHYLLDVLAHGFGSLAESLPSPWLVALIPAAGGLAVGAIRVLWVPEAFEVSSATDAWIDSVHERGGRVRARAPFATMITSAITLGTGGSAGREGPTIFVGGGLGYLSVRLFEWMRLPRRLNIELGRTEIRTLVICGAAAGLGAVFRAPLGAALFASSVLYVYGIEFDVVLPAMVSSVTSYLVFSVFFGFEPMFQAPAIWNFNFADLVVVVVIGVLASLVGMVYVRVFYRVFHFFRALALPDWLKPGLGGLGVGLIAVAVPQVWGIGYDTVQDIIDYRITAGVLLLVLLGKVLATSLTIGSGGAGGDMAPALFIGAAVGGLVGRGMEAAFPELTLHPTLYVIAGMGALYSAVGKVPLSTAILLAESTRNFTMIVPLIIANTTGFFAAGRHTIYESQHADATRERADVLRHVPVGDILHPVAVSAPLSFSAQDVLRLIGETGHHGFPVLDEEGRLYGIVSWTDARGVPYQERRDTSVADICTREVVTLLPHDTSRRALDILDTLGIGRIVVVAEDDPLQLVGVITKEDVIRAYAERLKID